MKSKIIFLAILTFFIQSCSTPLFFKEPISIDAFFKEEISVDDLLIAKTKIDNSTNPAEVLLLKKNLSEKKLILKNVTVKDIIISTNVDYDFCVLADIKSDKGPIECFIYTKNIRRISQLKKEQSVIDVNGEFKRYFSMLDNYYTKIEITGSTITIIKE